MVASLWHANSSESCDQECGKIKHKRKRTTKIIRMKITIKLHIINLKHPTLITLYT